uniref:BTB domain-containing protein n=1 Tax=Meloidogyne incognita TaxID=6306 RepID=A0A914LDW5_MELIC
MSGCSSSTDVTCDGEPNDVVEWPKYLLVNADPRGLFGNKPRFMGTEERILGITLETNEEGMLTGSSNRDESSVQFELKYVDLVFKYVEEKHSKGENVNPEDYFDISVIVVPQVRISGASWKAIVQARFYVSDNIDELKLAFSEILCLSNECSSSNPLTLNFGPNVITMKMEMRYIYESYNELPTFYKGDMSVYFSPFSSPALMDRALMALYTPKLVMSGEVMPPCTSFFPDYNMEREEFIQLLYKIYRSKCPLNDDNFRALCSAASKLGNELLLWPLYKNIVNDTSLDFPQRVNKSLQLGLDYAAKQMCYNAVKSGEWQNLQEKGFNARDYFGDIFYYKTVIPTIIEAIRDQLSYDPKVYGCLYEQKYPHKLPTFDTPADASDPNNVGLLIDGKIIFVNIGILRTFSRLECFYYENGAYHPKISNDLKEEMSIQNLRLIQIVLPLFQLLYGVNNYVQSNLVRACLIFANDHQMNEIVGEMEELLINELIDSPEKLLNHLKLAEKYGLKNLERKSLWQLECKEYHKFGLEMINLPEYQKLRIRNFVEERLCCGWAVEDEGLAKKEPTLLSSFLLNIDQNSKVIVKSMANSDILSVKDSFISDEPTFKSVSQSSSTGTAISNMAVTAKSWTAL